MCKATEHASAKRPAMDNRLATNQYAQPASATTSGKQNKMSRSLLANLSNSSHVFVQKRLEREQLVQKIKEEKEFIVLGDNDDD